MAHRGIEFRHTDSPPLQAKKLNALSERVHYIQDDVRRIDAQSSQMADGMVPDPGDLRVYFENGLT